MKIEEKYIEYQKLYRKYEKLREQKENYELEKCNLEKIKNVIERKMRGEKKKEWDRLQERKKEIQFSINYVEQKCVSYEEIIQENGEEDFENIYWDYEDTWWNGVKQDYIEESLKKDAYYAQMWEIERKESAFEAEFERKIVRKLKSLDSRCMENDMGEDIEQIQSTLLALRSEIENQPIRLLEDGDARLCDSFYISEKRTELPGSICAVRHEKKPIVFLYKSDFNDLDKISDFIKHINEQIITVNGLQILNVYMNYYGMDLSERQMSRRISETAIGTDIITYKGNFGELTNIVNDNIDRNFACCKNSDLDNYNAQVFQDNGEGSNDYLKWSVVHIYIPVQYDHEREAMNADFFGAIEDGSRYGLIPIFYISEEEWNNDDIENKTVISIKQNLNKIGFTKYYVDVDNWKVTGDDIVSDKDDDYVDDDDIVFDTDDDYVDDDDIVW